MNRFLAFWYLGIKSRTVKMGESCGTSNQFSEFSMFKSRYRKGTCTLKGCLWMIYGWFMDVYGCLWMFNTPKLFPQSLVGQVPVTKVVPAAVHFPPSLEPELLACSPEGTIAMTRGGMGAFLPASAAVPWLRGIYISVGYAGHFLEVKSIGIVSKCHWNKAPPVNFGGCQR